MSFNFSDYVYIQLPEGQVQTISRKSDGVVIWKRRGINRVLQSTESDGRTIYNGGLGYKDGFRIRSGGTEQESTSICTGFIPVKAGDVIRVKDKKNKSIYVANNTVAINYADINRTNIGQTSGNYFYGIATSYGQFTDIVSIGSDNSWTFTVIDHADIYYIRITVDNHSGAVGEDLVVTVNEDIV